MKTYHLKTHHARGAGQAHSTRTHITMQFDAREPRLNDNIGRRLEAEKRYAAHVATHAQAGHNVRVELWEDDTIIRTAYLGDNTVGDAAYQV